ncbi:SHOCT domain-containing protein [Sphingopyxis indica]|uniref:SHOCT domain-containing protein n=1 Tax=Sphingopyxis indica TaxID=436663 RepID=UPI0029390F3C|nr:SHOCT domain-containing protein [Sphingopyxis indica]WOF44369.1 SHOCT domain-containing protein [Sphingopyxis indica]
MKNVTKIALAIAGLIGTVSVAYAQDDLVPSDLKTANISSATPSRSDIDYDLFRRNGEEAVKSLLIDPGSAQFEWPYGFLDGYWKPFLRKRVNGLVTCGRVNARNRMGGYTGPTYFVVVMDRSGAVLFKELGESNEMDFVSASCTKSAGSFPPPPAITQAEAVSPAPSTPSLADQLQQLVSLRDSGALTPDEFEAAKKKLLAQP